MVAKSPRLQSNKGKEKKLEQASSLSSKANESECPQNQTGRDFIRCDPPPNEAAELGKETK